jgi:hypothetical protein
MRNAISAILLTCIVAAVPGVQAQDEDPETQVKIKAGEVARLDRDSIGDYGSTKRFEVDIGWDDAAGQRPADHKTRKVRYAADCKAGTVTIVAVGVFDRTGRLEKRMIVPPGASDPIKPEAGTPQAKWLRDVCMT